MVWEIQWEIKEVRGTLGDSSGKGNAHESMANFTKLANCTALGAIGGRSQGTSMLGGLRPGLGCPPEHGSDSESEPCSSGAARAQAAGVAAAQHEPSGSGSGAGGNSRPRGCVCPARGRWQTPQTSLGGALRRKWHGGPPGPGPRSQAGSGHRRSHSVGASHGGRLSTGICRRRTWYPLRKGSGCMAYAVKVQLAPGPLLLKNGRGIGITLVLLRLP
jgi:hypothetical protein